MLTNNYLFQKNSVLSTGFNDLRQIVIFLDLNSEGDGSDDNKSIILFLGSVIVPMSVISAELYFVQIS